MLIQKENFKSKPKQAQPEKTYFWCNQIQTDKVKLLGFFFKCSSANKIFTLSVKINLLTSLQAEIQGGGG